MPKPEHNISDLIQTLSNEDEDLCYEAIETLKSIGMPTVDPLIEAMDHEDFTVRLSIVEILGTMNNEKSFTAVMAALSDNDNYVRETAIEALSKTKNETAIEALIPLLSDDDAGIRESAKQSLENYDHQLAIEALSKYKQDSADKAKKQKDFAYHMDLSDAGGDMDSWSHPGDL
jgi:HEAT repeat protein